MKLLLSNHIYEFVSALVSTEMQIFVPDNAKRQKPIVADNVHIVPQEVLTDEMAAVTYILQNQIDVVYAQGRGAMVFFARVRRRLKGRWKFKIIVTVHTGYVWRVWWKSLMLLMLARWYSEGLVFLAETFRQRYEWFAKIIGLKTWVVRNPVDLSRFPVEHDYSRIGKGTLHLGYVGIITPMKGQDVLIDAVRLLHKRGKKVKLTLVGDVQYEWYYDKLCAQVADAGLSGSVVLKPGMPYNEVPDFLATLDCYVCPSKIEVLPFNVLEAMASGLPIIAMAVGGIPDLVQGGVNGELVRDFCPSALASAVQMFDSGRCEKFGAASRKLADELFSNPRFSEIMLHVLEGL